MSVSVCASVRRSTDRSSGLHDLGVADAIPQVASRRPHERPRRRPNVLQRTEKTIAVPRDGAVTRLPGSRRIGKVANRSWPVSRRRRHSRPAWTATAAGYRACQSGWCLRRTRPDVTGGRWAARMRARAHVTARTPLSVHAEKCSASTESRIRTSPDRPTPMSSNARRARHGYSRMVALLVERSARRHDSRHASAPSAFGRRDAVRPLAACASCRRAPGWSAQSRAYRSHEYRARCARGVRDFIDVASGMNDSPPVDVAIRFSSFGLPSRSTGS